MQEALALAAPVGLALTIAEAAWIFALKLAAAYVCAGACCLAGVAGFWFCAPGNALSPMRRIALCSASLLLLLSGLYAFSGGLFLP